MNTKQIDFSDLESQVIAQSILIVNEFNSRMVAAAFARFERNLRTRFGPTTDCEHQLETKAKTPAHSEDSMSDIPLEDDAAEADPSDPDKRLKELQAQLKANEDSLSTLTKERDALKADVDSLAKTVDEITKARAAFEKGLADLAAEKKKISDYDAKKAPMIDAALGPKKEPVVAKIKEVEATISKKDGEVKTATTESEKANQEAADADATLKKKQAAYDEYKTLQKVIGDKIQKMNEYRTKVEKYDDPPKPASMYVFLRELETVLAEAKVPTEEEFSKELNHRWQELDDSKEVARKKKLAAEAAKTKLGDATTELGSLRKKRIDDLVSQVDPLND